MQARGPLMGEHRLIERMIGLIKAAIGQIHYPKHIEKEDQPFFPASRAYFTDEEDPAMLAELGEFDRKMLHEKYKTVVTELGG